MMSYTDFLNNETNTAFLAYALLALDCYYLFFPFRSSTEFIREAIWTRSFIHEEGFFLFPFDAPRGIWDLSSPDQGLKPRPLHWGTESHPLDSQGGFSFFLLNCKIYITSTILNMYSSMELSTTNLMP